MGAPYGSLVARCGRCLGPIEVCVESDGDGGIMDIVQPCPTCAAPKMVLRPLARPRQSRALIGLKTSHPMMQLAIGKARALLEVGDMSVVRISQLVGISTDHVRKLKREIETANPKSCGCGRSLYHGGRCWWRRNQEGPKDAADW